VRPPLQIRLGRHRAGILLDDVREKAIFLNAGDRQVWLPLFQIEIDPAPAGPAPMTTVEVAMARVACQGEGADMNRCSACSLRSSARAANLFPWIRWARHFEWRPASEGRRGAPGRPAILSTGPFDYFPQVIATSASSRLCLFPRQWGSRRFTVIRSERHLQLVQKPFPLVKHSDKPSCREGAMGALTISTQQSRNKPP